MDFIALVRASLARFGVDPSLLELEVTESVAMQDIDLAKDRLKRMRELGVSLAIDDFGTGYSSLARLIELPISRLKLDRSLLEGLAAQPDSRTLVQTMVNMAGDLKLESVAEGVETQEQLEILQEMGCDVIQGFLLSRPIDEATLRSQLHKSKQIGEVNGPVTDAA